ncbi:hypothetical protein [Nocardioides sp. SR21]|uniref:hypothetical protein n=1 Tax=Nocardioides sp. SR21 TaxID=2919501 RepID=UPI001FA9D7AC|nr:hypothetical protein [Nocardioides sp. SR21]
MTTSRMSLSRSARGAALTLALAGITVPAAAVPASPAEPQSRACAAASAPYAVGTTTLRTRSRGASLQITVAYPATSNGENAKPVCRASHLVVAGHGSGGDGPSAARLHTYLVQQGYVVAAPTFASGYDFGGYTEDVSRTITKVKRSSRTGGGVLAGRVKDKAEVGYIGTSMGGILGLALVDRDGRDKRIGAVVSKAGTAMGGSFQGAGGPPLLMINGNADTVISYDDARQSYRRVARPKGFITLDRVGHDLNTGGDPILVESSAGFFDRYLRGRKAGVREIQKSVGDSRIATLRSAW